MRLDIVSKHRAVIYGFAILWIVIFHASAINGVDYSFGHKSLVPFKRLIGAGNVGVDMFLFLSGISLYYSFAKNSNVAEFLQKRFARIVPAVWLVDGIYWLVRYLILKGDVVGFASRMTLLRFWMTGDSSIWFVSLIIVLYLAFPLVYFFLFDEHAKWNGVLRFVALMLFIYAVDLLLWKVNPDLYDQVEIAITRIPVFILGIWLGRFVFEKRELPKGAVAVVIGLALLFIIVIEKRAIHGPALRFFFLVGGVSLSYCIALICCLFDKIADTSKRPLYRFLSWTGGFSLELYITHIALNQILRLQPFYEKGNLTQYAIMAVAAFFLAWFVSKAITWVKLRRTSSRNERA